jgi:asparagine synthase (glutamine-hydrolysing)
MCNGEIYNYIELRDSLEGRGHSFYTKGDTETIVHAYESWGLDFVHHLRGMFAIAIWDSLRARLVLARDRIGKKPLYYSANHGQLAFASELKALLRWPGLDRTLDHTAVQDYLRFLYIPEPRSIFAGVSKLLPGHLLVADAHQGTHETRRYWRFEISPNSHATSGTLAGGLRERLEEAVLIRLRSDVPLGAFLSGGVDSSTIVALMAVQEKSRRPLTFTMGFQDTAFDETPFARKMAEHVGSEHYEEVAEPVTPELLRRIVWHLDEPFADSSAIPTYLICQAARSHVTVALSGDGGDEMFAGYRHHRHARLITLLSRLPQAQLRMMQAAVVGAQKRLADRVPSVGASLRRAARALTVSLLPGPERTYYLTQYFDLDGISRLLVPEIRRELESYRLEDELAPLLANLDGQDAVDTFLYVDTVMYLPGDILTKVDRMSMAHGLEVRCPFLDQEVVEFASAIPAKLKLRRGSSKHILKQAVSDLLPAETISRGKHGFALPLSSWLQTTFRDDVIDCLSSDSVRRRGLLQAKEVERLRDRALALGFRGNDSGSNQDLLWHQIWALYMLELWCREFLPQ